MIEIDKHCLLWAIQDNSGTAWFLNTVTGELVSNVEGFGEEGADPEPPEEDIESGKWVEVDSLLPSEAFEFMEEFVAGLEDGPARLALASALGGKGSFRRFRDTISRFEDASKRWSECEEKRLEAAAREFLDELGIEYTLK